MGVNFYEIAVSFVGQVPPQYEIIYFIVMVLLIICAILICIAPITLILFFRK